MKVIWVLIGWLFHSMQLTPVSAESHTKVEFAMDKRRGLNPDNRLQLSLMLFNFRLMESQAAVDERTDLFAHANWTTVERFRRESGKQPETYVDMDPSVVELFENKALWKGFMKEIGLESYTAQSYHPDSEPPEAAFPLVVKTNHHFGHGTHIVKNIEDYRTKVEFIRAHGHTFLVEEALTGMGLAEMSAFGSVYKGRLLSLRCAIRTFNADSVINQQEQSHRSVTTADPATDMAEGTPGAGAAGPGGPHQHMRPFVRGFQLKPTTDTPCPCGQDLVAAAKQMFANMTLPYTGPFCIDAKLDKNQKLKMMEVNARFCGSLAAGDGLFVATFVPLAYAVVEALPFTAAYNRSALYHGPHRAVYEHIRKEEQMALDTGGGLTGGQWVTVPEFNHTLTSDRLYDYFLKTLAQRSQRGRNSGGRSAHSHSHSHSHSSRSGGGAKSNPPSTEDVDVPVPAEGAASDATAAFLERIGGMN